MLPQASVSIEKVHVLPSTGMPEHVTAFEVVEFGHAPQFDALILYVITLQLSLVTTLLQLKVK